MGIWIDTDMGFDDIAAIMVAAHAGSASTAFRWSSATRLSSMFAAMQPARPPLSSGRSQSTPDALHRCWLK